MTPGAEAYVDGLCGAQFALKPLRVRLIRQLDFVTLGPDLVWVHVYELTCWGDAVQSRDLLVIRPAFEAALSRGLRAVVVPPKPNSAHRRSSVPRPRKEVSRAPAL